MIDTIVQILRTIFNKELKGNITPAEINLIAKQAQDEIFRGYFNDENLDKNKENKGLTNRNFANLAFNQRQLTEQFSESATIVGTPSLEARVGRARFNLPEDIYFIKDRGISYLGNVVEEVEGSDLSFLNSSKAAPSSIFPVYQRFSNFIDVYPSLSNIQVEYLRTPSNPKWTYVVVNGSELFNPSATDYQDFELHPSESPRIVIEMLSLFGINLDELDVSRYAEVIKKAIKYEPSITQG